MATLDVLIRGGWVIDGAGNPPTRQDVGIVGDRIAALGQLRHFEARETIDAKGKIVCPGFVDADGHSDYSMFTNPTQESTVRQGVTTEVVGGCGNSFAPVSELSRAFIAGRMSEQGYDGPISWSSFEDYLGAIAKMRTSCNFAFLAGHNAIRYAAGVTGTEPSLEQLRTMEEYVREAMSAGALGLSSGLEFEPGRSAGLEELARLSEVAAEQDGMYVSHIRNRDAYLQEAVDEFVEIVRRGSGRGHLQHLNVRDNTGVPDGGWQRAVDAVEAARSEGLDILSDAYPFRFALGLMAGVLPGWLFEDGVEGALRGLRDPATRKRLKGDCDRYWRHLHRGDWDRVYIQGSRDHPELNGKSFAEIATLRGKDPWDCYFDVLVDAGSALESVPMVGINFTDEHLAEMATHPLFCLSPDTWSSSTEGPMAELTQHPIPYCGHIHFLTHHVRKLGLLTLQDAIRKLTSMPANHFGLHDRGVLAEGLAADVVVFDYDELEDVSSWDNPVAYARGVEWVLVNGTVTVADGDHNGARAGTLLRRQ